MEMEVMEARLIRAAEVNGEVDDDDAGGSQVEEAGGPEWQGLMPSLGNHTPCLGLSPFFCEPFSY